MSHNLYVTRAIPEAGLEILREHCDTVEVNPHDRGLTREELLQAVRNRDGVLCLPQRCINPPSRYESDSKRLSQRSQRSLSVLS